MTTTCCSSNHLEVTFIDSNFKQIIRNTIGKPTGPIYPKDCESITSLDA